MDNKVNMMMETQQMKYLNFERMKIRGILLSWDGRIRVKHQQNIFQILLLSTIQN